MGRKKSDIRTKMNEQFHSGSRNPLPKSFSRAASRREWKKGAQPMHRFSSTGEKKFLHSKFRGRENEWMNENSQFALLFFLPSPFYITLLFSQTLMGEENEIITCGELAFLPLKWHLEEVMELFSWMWSRSCKIPQRFRESTIHFLCVLQTGNALKGIQINLNQVNNKLISFRPYT